MKLITRKNRDLELSYRIVLPGKFASYKEELGVHFTKIFSSESNSSDFKEALTNLFFPESLSSIIMPDTIMLHAGKRVIKGKLIYILKMSETIKDTKLV